MSVFCFHAVAVIGWYIFVKERENWKRVQCGSGILKSAKKSIPEIL